MRYTFLSNPGAIRIGGDDRAAFLQRQSSNDVRLLKPGRAVLTVLTSPTGRILDALLLLDEGTSLLALTVPGRGEATVRFLKSRIFFMDKVTVQDVSGEYVQGEVWGKAGNGFPDTPNHTTVFDPEGANGVLIRHEACFGLGWRLLAPAAQAQQSAARLESMGAQRLEETQYEIARIEATLPGPGELTEAYTPLEVGLAGVVNESKGCYTGQEVLARQVTYDKVTQALVRLRLPAPLPVGERLKTNSGDLAGQITSSAISPLLGPLALAVVKRPHHADGTEFADGAIVG